VSNHKEKELEEVEETTPVGSDNNTPRKEGCVKLSKTSFVLCPGFAYAFYVGRKTIIGIVVEINARFLRVVVETESGKVLIDLRKVSMVSEVK
jgi:hypothetical protein